jgi:hypothetical protein
VQQIIKSLDIPMDKVVELLAKYVPQTAAEAYSMSISSNSEGA